jgi:NitT/TauT family transport system permease protein
MKSPRQETRALPTAEAADAPAIDSDTATAAPPQTVGDARARKPSRWRRFASSGLANGVPVFVLIAWWWVAQRTPEFVIPDPVAVGEQTIRLLFGDMYMHTLTSFVRIVTAVVVAMALGGALVFLAKLLPVTERLVGDRIVPFLDSIPSLGWAILGVIWFGVTNTSVVFVLTAILLPFCMVNLWEGMRAIDPDLREMGRSFTRQRLRVLTKIEIPLLMPYAFAALRLSFSVGWKVALIAEFFGARAGLGLVMNRARQGFDTPTVFATIAVVLVIVFAAERLVFEPVGKRFARRTGTEHAL